MSTEEIGGDCFLCSGHGREGGKWRVILSLVIFIMVVQILGRKTVLVLFHCVGRTLLIIKTQVLR